MEASRRTARLTALVSVAALIATGTVLALIPFWFGALDTWSLTAVGSPLCVVAAVAATALLLRGAPRWARVAACGFIGGAVHLATLTTFYGVASFEWAVVWSVGTGAIVVAVIGGMLSGVHQRPVAGT